MYKRVVVPLDGSRLAEGMLRFIVAEAVAYLSPLAADLRTRGIRVRTEVRRGSCGRPRSRSSSCG